MDIRKVKDGVIVDANKYSIFIDDKTTHKFRVKIRGQKIFDIPFISALSTDEDEILSELNFSKWEEEENAINLKVVAKSNIWEERVFYWSFKEEYIDYKHTAKGNAKPERCFFFSNGISGKWDNGDSKLGFEYNTVIYAKEMFSPKPNLSNQHYYDISRSQSLGIKSETKATDNFNTEQMSDGLYCPPLLNLCFKMFYDWASIGIGEFPDKYLFNSLEYVGSSFAGCSFYVNYLGYTPVQDLFESPKATIHFGSSEFEVCEKYVNWLDYNKFSTVNKYKSANWHRLPFFCSWGEQTHLSHTRNVTSGSLATQENFEKWIEVLEKYKIPVGNIVIDDKWQSHYGTFEIDKEKWPDMKGFIDEQHKKGRHVLLWCPGHHYEGLDKELCVLDEDGSIITGDVTNPAYEKYIRSQIKHLVTDIGVDGFKEDWVGGFANKKGLIMHSPLIGIEFLRKFQYILYDETHSCKPDALIETQTPFPLFRESSDMIRLNDLWYGTRDVVSIMRLRAKLASIAGWNLFDCDNGSSTHLDLWWEYMQEQPNIGVPALYCLTKTETTFEQIPEEMLVYLAGHWNKYINKHC